MGISKLGVLVTLNTSKLNFRFVRSVMLVSLTKETSRRRCHDCRKILRCPVVKSVSYGSFVGIAPFKPPAGRIGMVKQEALSAGRPGVAPLAPVTAFFAVQPGASGTMGLLMPSLTP